MGMQPDHDLVQWAWALLAAPVTWVLRVVWVNHKDIQDIREEIASNYATKHDLRRCSDDKDQRLNDIVEPLKEGHNRIEAKLDKLIDRELNK